MSLSGPAHRTKGPSRRDRPDSRRLQQLVRFTETPVCSDLDHVIDTCLVTFQHLWGRETRLRWTAVSRFVPSAHNNLTHLCGLLDCDVCLCVSVDGGWCQWSEWTPCSKTCGMEWVSRYRSCACPEPKSGGAACPDQQEEHTGLGVQIQRQPCPSVSFCPGETFIKPDEYNSWHVDLLYEINAFNEIQFTSHLKWHIFI